MKKSLCVLLLLCGLWAINSPAYVFTGRKWAAATTSFYVDIPSSDNLWNPAFEGAMASWNANTPFRYTIVRATYADPCNSRDRKNGVGFQDSECGDAFGDALAVTLSIAIQGILTETDIVFDRARSWNVYSGPLRQALAGGTLHDFRRVSVHELGHALGLDHELSQPSIMRPTEGQYEGPQPDDIAGVNALYGGGGVTPTPTVQLSSTSLSFGTQSVNVDSAAQTVTLTNTGQAVLSLSGINVQGANASDFRQNGSCGASVAVGASCSLNIVFRPGSAGTKVASIAITGNASNSPQSIALSGTGGSTATGATVNLTAVSSVSGNEGGVCVAPLSIGSFPTTIAQVYIYVGASGVAVGDVFRASYYKPNGTLHTSNEIRSSLSGNVCFSYLMAVAGSTPGNLPGNWTVQITVNSSAAVLASRIFTLSNAGGNSGTRPSINLGGVVTVSATAPVMTPLGYVSIYGQRFTNGVTQSWNGANLTTSLGGASVSIGGQPAYIIYVTPTFMNIQVPNRATSGSVAVTLSNASGTSDPVMVSLATIAPEFKSWNPVYVESTRGTGPLCGGLSCPVAPSGMFSNSAPARPGETISLWGLGWGPSSPAIAPGTIGRTPYPTVSPIAITIGGTAVTVPYGSYLQGVGLYQTNIIVPNLPDGDYDIVASVGGVRMLKTLKLSIKR